MTDNVTYLEEYRARFQHPTAPKWLIRQHGDNVGLGIADPVVELSPEQARKLAEALIDLADRIEDWG